MFRRAKPLIEPLIGNDEVARRLCTLADDSGMYPTKSGVRSPAQRSSFTLLSTQSVRFSKRPRSIR
jgi:hypothetical protein